MLQLINALFTTLNQEGIRYCHWKSNINLNQMLSGKTDIDLLVDQRDADRFDSIIAGRRFKSVAMRDLSVHHYYGLDHETGNIIHLHMYYRIVTGGTILKNYKLPLEDMLLQSCADKGIIPVPSKSAELAVLVIRKILECSSFIEFFFFLRDFKSIKAEMDWLYDADTEKEAIALLQYWLPSIKPQLFSSCIKAIQKKSTFELMSLSLKIRSCLRNYRIYNFCISSVIRDYLFLRRIFSRVVFQKKGTHRLYRGGVVIAIVGPDASGKSTVVRKIANWLADNFAVKTVHTGKPGSTFVSFIPNLFLPLLRRALPYYRSENIEREFEINGTIDSVRISRMRGLIYSVRSVMLAHDREKLLKKTHEMASRGGIVICDRYPSYEIGAMDSFKGRIEKLGNGLTRFLASTSYKIYRRIPPPDIVINLYVPLHIAVERNVSRREDEFDSEDYLKRRHRSTIKQKYTTSRVYVMNTERDIAETLLRVKRAIWECL